MRQVCTGSALIIASREREGYRLNTSSPHHVSLSFSSSHLLPTMSPGRRKGYEELFGCLEQETAGTNWPRCLQSASPSLGSDAILQLASPYHRAGPAFKSHCAGKSLGASEAVRPLPPLCEMQEFCSEAAGRRFLSDVKHPSSPGRTGHRAPAVHWEELRKGGVPAGSVCITPKWLFLPVGA